MMTENTMGIDVSREWLDVDTAAERSVRIENNGRGHYRIFAMAKRLNIGLVVLESTGGYEKGIVEYLSKKGLGLSMANPRQVRDFAKGLGILAKTDALDAGVLRAFGEAIPQRRYVRPSQDQARLCALVKERMHVVRLLASERQRLAQLDPAVCSFAKRLVENLATRLKQLDQALSQASRAFESVDKNNKLLCQITGMGKLTATSLQALLPELGQVNSKEIAALAGLAPYNRDSGKRRGGRCIWGGREPVRRALWMAAVCASTHNAHLRSFYRRLVDNGKPAKVALTAVMRKILIQCNAIIRDQEVKQHPLPA